VQKPVVTHYTFDTGQHLSEPVRIAHVSDLHERDCDDILAMLKEQKPDVIMVTGDTFERYDNRPQYDFYRKPVKRLIVSALHYANYLFVLLMPKEKKASVEYAHSFLSESVKIAPVYMSMGNHEQKLLDEDYEFLSGNGIHLLDNADMPLTIKDFECVLGGMSCWDYEEWLPTYLAKDGFKLLMCHQPHLYVNEVEGKGVDLTLSGHTHGGQMRIGKKGRGFFVPGQGILGKYAHGSFFDGRLIVSAGCSNTVAAPRFFNPRELVMIDLK